MKALILVLGLAVAGCATTSGKPTEVRTVIQKVPVRAACPDKATYDKLKATRPRPLRTQAMPATAEERSAKTAAQLGRFEAEGGWADRAEAALDRCQLQEGVAPSP